MFNLNKVMVLGNLTRDIELRHFANGSAVANTGIAINRRTKKQDGGYYEETVFIDVKVFGRTAEILNQHAKKGTKLYIEGRLAQDSWVSQDGKNMQKLYIIAESISFAESKKDSKQAEEVADMPEVAQAPEVNQAANASQAQESTFQDEDIEVSMPGIREEQIPF